MGRKKTRSALTYETLPALFKGICDAIRSKTGGSDPINHQDIPATIATIGGITKILDLVSSASTSSAAPIEETLTGLVAGKLTVIVTSTIYQGNAPTLTIGETAQTATKSANKNIASGSNCYAYIWENITIDGTETIKITWPGTFSANSSAIRSAYAFIV